MTNPIRVLLADGHDLFRAGSSALLRILDGIEVVGEASNGREAIDLCKKHRADVVLMDVMMSQLNGLDATVRLAPISPNTRTIILSQNASEDHAADVDYITDVARLIASGEPSRNHVDEISRVPLPSGHSSRRWDFGIKSNDGTIVTEPDPWSRQVGTGDTRAQSFTGALAPLA
jgi:chemotaxis response regulator CheB